MAEFVIDQAPVQSNLADRRRPDALDAVIFTHDRKHLQEGGWVFYKNRFVGGIQIAVTDDKARIDWRNQFNFILAVNGFVEILE